MARFAAGVLVGYYILALTMFAAVGYTAEPLTMSTDLSTEAKFEHARQTSVLVEVAGGSGSGVVIACEPNDVYPEMWDAYILTAGHVVGDSLGAIVYWWGEDYKPTDHFGEIVYREDRYRPEDLAIIRVMGLIDPVKVATLVDPDNVPDIHPGTELWIAGYPAWGLPTVTFGHILEVGPTLRIPYMRMNIPITYGNSGGPVYLNDGRVLSIAVQIQVNSGWPVWHVSKAITPDHISAFLLDADMEWLFQ